MKILFSLKEHHLFSTIKFILNNQKKPKKVKIISFCILFVLFSASIAYLYYQNSNIYLIIFLVIFYAVFLFLFLKFIDYCFEKFIRKYIEKNYFDLIWKVFSFEILENQIIFSVQNWDLELKIKRELILDTIYEKNYIFLLLRKDFALFIPKSELSEKDLSELQKLLILN